MSTAPAVSPLQQAQNLINAAYRELCGRIKTGKLRNSSRNGALLVGRVKEVYPELFSDWQSKGFPTVKQVADAFYAVLTKEPEFAILLDWEVVPKALAPKKQGEPAKFGDQREASSFEERVRAGEKAAAAQKLQDEAKKRCLQIVERFTPVNKRGLMYGLRDEHQGAWRKRISATKDFVKLERQIKDEQRKIYESLERAAERI